MKYAIIGDIHSSTKDLKQVLAHIKTTCPDAKIIGTGDLFECTISKKEITNKKFHALDDVMIHDDEFDALLNFPSVSGNQEERILQITKTEEPLRQWIAQLPEKMTFGQAMLIHGHQWTWGGNPWKVQQTNTSAQLVFYGHSHQSGLMRDGAEESFEFHQWIDGSKGQVLVNVGSVIDHQEWVLYDDIAHTFMFMKA